MGRVGILTWLLVVAICCGPGMGTPASGGADRVAGDLEAQPLTIVTDREWYTPFMSVTVGIGLTPAGGGDRSGAPRAYRWHADFGHFVHWGPPQGKVVDLGHTATSHGEKIYWSMLSGQGQDERIVTVVLEELDPTGKAMATASLQVAVQNETATVVPGSSGPYLAWELHGRHMGDDLGPLSYFPEAVTWMDARGQPRWRVQLPSRMRQRQAGIGDAEARALRESPRRSLQYLPFLCGILHLEDTVVLGDASGLLVLDRKDGSVRLDFAGQRTGDSESLFFDRGTYQVKAKDGRVWTGSTRRAAFVALCDDRLVYFNGRTLAVFATHPWARIAELSYQEKLHRQSSGPARVSARFQLEGLEVVLQGIVYLR